MERKVYEFQAVIEPVPDKGEHISGFRMISEKSSEKDA